MDSSRSASPRPASGADPERTVEVTDAEPMEFIQLTRGAIVGRHVILSRVGEGGMGVVYDAYDPELARKLAIKFLRARGETDGSGPHRRLLREAQALARLSHPNVVAIYDVGVLDHHVWLAMEFVDGQTVTQWLRSGTRSWAEVLAVMTAAGHGLAAAHAAGLVHRDFKPDNVMVGADGRVRVMDFGLARTGVGIDHARADPSAPGPAGAAATERSTIGLVVGTPAYMAPEQHAGLGADARSDQFSFCVTLWESLYGRRPFAGNTPAAVATAVLEGAREPPPPDVRVPTWCKAICDRGLASDPERRFASMQALLDAIERGRGRTRRRRWIAALGGMALVPGGLWVDARLGAARHAGACADESARMAVTWPGEVGERRTAAQASILGIDRPYAATTAERVLAGLDAYAEQWSSVRLDACTATPTPDPRIAECLDEQRIAMEAFASQLTHADPEIVAHAAAAVAALHAPARCVDPAALALRPRQPDAGVDEIRGIREQLAQAGAVARAGKYAQADAIAREAAERARVLGWAPLLAEANRVVASVAGQLGEFDRAKEALVEAYVGAGTSGAFEQTAAAALALADNALFRDRADEAELWIHVGEVAGAGILDTEQSHAARLALLHSQLAFARGDFAGARDAARRGIELDEANLGPDSIATLHALARLASAEAALGDYAAASALHERALAGFEAALGPEHPQIAASLDALGVLAHQAGDMAAARRYLERALAVCERALGREHMCFATSSMSLGNVESVYGNFPRARELHLGAIAIGERQLGAEHRKLGGYLVNLAIDLQGLGEFAQARSVLARSIAIIGRAAGPDHADLVPALVTLATVEAELGDLDGAIVSLERVRPIGELRLGAQHPTVAAIEVNLGNFELRRGEPSAARLHYEHALGIATVAVDPQHPLLAYIHAGLGELALVERDFDTALAEFELALAAHEQLESRPPEIADARFGVAQALWETGGDRRRAHALALAALREYEAIDERKGVATATAWLAKHHVPAD